jgi:lipooligosaccharide transport system ATP-binding protein
MSAAEGEPIVLAKDLVKAFGNFRAVDGIEFRIPKGSCFGFLGPNGAGKTSTMRMVQAVSAPTSGLLTVFGMDPVVDGRRVRSRLGVVPQDDNLDPDLTVRENLVVYGRYFGMSRRNAQGRAAELLDFAALGDRRDRSIRELSGGMKRRLVIARALVNDPELVVLDEPTTGLDPQARHLIWQRLSDLRGRGVTLVLTTHNMDEAERLCDSIVIMDRGKILAAGSPSSLVREHVGDEVVELKIEEGRENVVTSGLSINGVQSERAGELLLFFLPRRSPLADQIVVRAHSASVQCRLRHATLEDVFLRLAGRELVE